MTPIVPLVAIVHYEKVDKRLRTNNIQGWFASDINVLSLLPSDTVADIPRSVSLVILIGPKMLHKNFIHVQKPTLHLDSIDDLNADLIYSKYVELSVKDKNPTVSIFTPTYNTFKKFDRAYDSVIRQCFKDWEWVILDDSPNDDNYNYIIEKTKQDQRIKVYRKNFQDGFVGSTKRQAASLCNGDYLLELDHDDELHFMALEYVVAAFRKFPDAGFCYTNSTELYETGGHVIYGNNFGMNFGRHFEKHYKGRIMLGCDTPINASTMRHIVGVPNHIRCWKRDVYFNLARHNNKLAVVDDYELLVRTFLKTKMIHVRELLYIQYMNSGGNNTQEPRRAEIQRLVDHIQRYYDKQIHERVLELGGDDWVMRSELPLNNSTLAYVF